MDAEFRGHQDDAVLEFSLPGGGTYLENGEITFSNFTLNYELEVKLGGLASFYAGAGIEYVSIDDQRKPRPEFVPSGVLKF